MATYRKRGNSWRAEIVRSGIRTSKTFKTKAEAVAWATVEESKIVSGESLAFSDRSLRDAMQRYHDYVSPTKRGVHWEQLRLKAFMRDLPFIDKAIHKVLPQDIASWRDERLQSVAGSTIRREANLISSVFTLAIKEWRWCKDNPVSMVIMPKEPRPRDRRITPDEEAAILLQLQYEPWQQPTLLIHELALLFLLALETAMRLGEMISLEWQHVHLDQRYVHLTLTKNGNARDVPLSSKAVKILQLMREKNGNNRQVFTLGGESASSLFRKYRRQADIHDLRFHDTRHEATTRLSQKLGMLELARVTGHRDPRMLMVYYNETAVELACKLD